MKMNKDEILQRHIKIKHATRKKLVSAKLFFFNLMLQKFIWELDFDCSDDAFAYIRFSNKDLNEIENGAIHVNGSLLKDPKFTSGNYLCLLIHEITHIIFLHGPRQNGRDALLWNLAADAQVNNLIMKLNFPTVEPPGGWEGGAFTLPDNLISGKTTEEIYELLESMQNSNCDNCQNKNGDSSSNSNSDSSKNGNPRYRIIESKQLSNGLTVFKIEDTKTKKVFTVTINQKQIQDQKNAHEAIKKIYNSCKDRGLIPSETIRAVDKILETKLDWAEVLENAIKHTIIVDSNNRNWQMPNKIFRPLGYILPGNTSSEIQKHGIGIISVDTSGSIRDKDISKFYDILIKSLNYFKEIIIIQHDAKVSQFIRFEAADKEKLLTFIKTKGFVGGGGTSHHEVYQKIQELYETESETISIYISVTDGYSDIEYVSKEFNWSKRGLIPTCILITDNGKLLSGVDNITQIKIN